jgi:hypothetical protein
MTPTGRSAGQARQVDCRLRVTGPLEHPSGARHEREDVPRAPEDRGIDALVGERAHGCGAVDRGDAGARRDVVDRHGERRAVQVAVALDHRRELERSRARCAHRHAHDPTRVAHDERDLLGTGELRGHHEVGLVLPLLAVADHHESAATEDLDRVRHSGQACLCHRSPCPTVQSSSIRDARPAGWWRCQPGGGGVSRVVAV